MNIKAHSGDCLAILAITLALCSIMMIVFKHSSSTSEKKEICWIGNVTLEMDSATAVNKINQRIIEINSRTNDNITLINNGDSVGYVYPLFNETFFVKLKNKQVHEINFTSDKIPYESILILNEAQNIQISEGQTFKYDKNGMLFEYDGKNHFVLKKR